MKLEAFLLVAIPVIGALAAVGAVLAIKISRRRQQGAAYGRGTAVPVTPMSRERAAALIRRYGIGVGLVLALLLLYGLYLAST